MFRPLLKVIPALSGNCKLACKLNDYIKISENEFIAIARTAQIYPLMGDAYQNVHDISLLNSSWEYDIAKFYNSGYADIFFTDTYSFDKNNMMLFKDSSVVKDRNVDIEFGCKRVSFIKSEKQLAFFAPIYCDNVDDLPDFFEIKVDIENNGTYSTKKTIKVDLSSKYRYNYLNLYMTKYFSKIDDTVIYMLPASQQAAYSGIDVYLGGFNTYKDNIISKIYNEETTINGYDACIADGFKRNHLIMKQVMPLSFYFSIDDILTDTERKKYKNAELYISGEYYKNGSPVSFYMFDDNYDELFLQVLKTNANTGKLEYQYIKNNILAINDNYGLNSSNVEEYRFSNKMNKRYVRWKMKYSSDEHPYITNTNYNFSHNQGLYNLYYEYPQNYYYTSIFCNIDKNDINLLLPLSTNIQKYYSNSNYLVNKYLLSLNNYISNWFDMTESLDIDDIIENTEWVDVHKQDNKVLYKGLLYDFSNIYKENIIKNKIDKFAVLFYVDDKDFMSEKDINNIVESKYVISHSEFNNIYTGIKADNIDIVADNLYELGLKGDVTPNATPDASIYFSYNSDGTGKYAELESLGLDYYDINKYILKDNIINSVIAENNENIIEGYEVLPIAYVSNIIESIYDDTSKKYAYNIILSGENIMYSINNSTSKYPISDLVVTENTIMNQKRYSYVFYRRNKFISYNTANTILSSTNNATVPNNVRSFSYVPKHILTTENTVSNVFVETDPHNKFYGSTTSYLHIKTDSDVLYLDPFNMKERLGSYYLCTGNLYIKNIEDTVMDDNSYKTIYIGDITDDNFMLPCIYNSDKLDIFDIENTYIADGNNIYDVNKLITKINSIYVNIESDSYTYIIPKNVKIEFIDNVYRHNSYISGDFYIKDLYRGNNMNINSYIVLSSYYNHDTNDIVAYFNDVATFNETAYKMSAITKYEDKYIYNQNCIGTYMYKDSTVFKHPQKLIRKIYNIPYSNDTLYIDDLSTSCFDIVKFYDIATDNVIYRYNEDLPLEKPLLKQLLYDSNETEMMYGKFLNRLHIIIFDRYIKEGALDIDSTLINKESRIEDYIYIKKTIITDNYEFKDVYIPLSQTKFIDNKNIINSIKYIKNYLFTIEGYDLPVELYFKKKFIKISRPIYEDIIALDTNEYKDLYIYRLSNSNDVLEEIQYTQDKYLNDIVSMPDAIDFSAQENVNKYSFSQSYSLTPLFDNVFMQEKYSTVLYKEYLLNNISEVNYIDDNNIITTLYRDGQKNMLCMIDIENLLKDYNVDKQNIKHTYDKLSTVYSNFINIVANEEIPFASYSDGTKSYKGYKINTYRKNNITYGFYINKIDLKNIDSVFSLMFTDYSECRYFTKINGVSIIDNHKYLTDNFKLLIPIIKYNVLNQLYSIPVLNTQYKTSFNKKYVNYTDNNGISHIIYDKNNLKNDNITLYRYYDNIIPRLIKTNNIQTEYYVKTRLLDKIEFSEIIYKQASNIYDYNGIRIYYDNDNFEIRKQLEYKYFNDNKFINLETSFEIYISKDLSEIELIAYQDEKTILKYFERYINKYRSILFNDTEILFLYNKYSVTLVSNSEKLNENRTGKLYSLYYKFTLK